MQLLYPFLMRKELSCAQAIGTLMPVSASQESWR